MTHGEGDEGHERGETAIVDKRAATLELAEETLELLELGEASLTSIVLRGSRIARLLDAGEAAIWMQLELRGYSEWIAGTPNWGTYAKWSGREGALSPEGQLYFLSPIEQIESDLESAREQLAALRVPSVMPSPSASSSPYMPSDTQKILDALLAQRATLTGTIGRWSRIVAILRGSIHDWLSRTVLQLKYGAVLDTGYDRLRKRFAALLAASTPDVASALAAASVRSDSMDPEEWSQAAASCRRALKALADSVAPVKPNAPEHLGNNQYRNRLAEFAREHLKREGRGRLVIAEIDALEARCKALDELANRGIHDRIANDELQLTIVHLFLLGGEILEVIPDAPQEPPPLRPDVDAQAAAPEIDRVNGDPGSP